MLAVTDMVGMVRAFVGGFGTSIDSVRFLRDILRKTMAGICKDLKIGIQKGI